MILVTGATGLIGRHLINRLMADGHPLRVLLDESKRKRIFWDEDDPAAPQVIAGTLMDEEALYRAVSGVYLIIHLENAMWWGRQRDLERVEIVGTRNLIAAARSARVGRILTLSHLGASPSSAFTLLRLKGQLEALIRDSGLAYTIIRPGVVFAADDVFINHIAMSLSLNPFFCLLPGIGEVVLHPVYIDDLIEAICRCLDDIRTVDETIEIGGLEYITLADLLQTVMRLTGMPRFVISVPPYLLRLFVRIQNLIFRRTLITQQWLDYVAASRTAPLNSMYHIFGIHPRRFEDTLLTYLPQKRLFWSALRHAVRRRPRSI